MMDDLFNTFSDPELTELINRYEQMADQGVNQFFDLDEFGDILDYYLFHNNKKRFAEAYETASKLHPENPVLLLVKARYLASNNREKEALKILEKIEEMPVSGDDIHLTRGSLYSMMNMPDKAIQAFTMGLNETDTPDEVFTHIAFEYENKGDFNKAVEFLIKALEINPESETALYELSYCCEINQQSDRLITFLKQFLDKYPYNKTAWFNLGTSYSNLELFEKAIDAYDFALAIDETFASAYFNKANSLANMKDYSGAVEVYQETLKLEDPEPITHYYIAECYEKMRYFVKAIEHYKEAIRLDPEFTDAWLGIGICFDELEKPSIAYAYVKKAVKLSPATPEYWQILGDIEIRLQRYPEGITSYQKVIELDPGNPDVWIDLAAVHVELNETYPALVAIEEGLSKHPGHPQLLYTKAYILLLEGRKKEAQDLLFEAMDLDADGYKRLFMLFPDARKNPSVLDFISEYRNR